MRLAGVGKIAAASGQGAYSGALPLPLPTHPPRRLFGVLTIPDIAREGADFVNRLKSDNVWVGGGGGAGAEGCRGRGYGAGCAAAAW